MAIVVDWGTQSTTCLPTSVWRIVTDHQRRNRWLLWGADLIVGTVCVLVSVFRTFNDATDWISPLLMWGGALLVVSATLVRPDI